MEESNSQKPTQEELPEERPTPNTPKPIPMAWVVIAILGYLLFQVIWITFKAG